jgi:hypothetical protein
VSKIREGRKRTGNRVKYEWERGGRDERQI